MAPYIWLFLKMFLGLLALGTVGFLIGWAVRGKNILSKIDRLESEAKSAGDEAEQARAQAEKLRKTNAKLENRIKGIEKNSAPREQFDEMKARLSEVDSDLGRLRRERDSAKHELSGFRETSVSGGEFSELRRELERQQSQVRKLNKQVGRRDEELGQLKARDVHDLVGFKDHRDDQIKDLTLENVRLREVLSKVQAGDKKSILQLADEARTATARLEGADPEALASGDLVELRMENEKIKGELESAKKRLLEAKVGGSSSTSGASLGVERENEKLKVALAKAEAGSSSSANDSTLKAEIAKLKKDRDQLVIKLHEAERKAPVVEQEAETKEEAGLLEKVADDLGIDDEKKA